MADMIADMLRATRPKKLLDAYASLTHRMHGRPEATGERDQRDLVEAEILRRIGGAGLESYCLRDRDGDWWVYNADRDRWEALRMPAWVDDFDDGLDYLIETFKVWA